MARAPESWNRYPRAEPAALVALQAAQLPAAAPRPLLAHGLGRSYGDVCLNDGGTLLLTRGLDRFIAFDEERGLLRCQSGVSLDDVLTLIVPRGWFLPVTPGTRFVTVGGAVANDVHGKNHHGAGTFGCHVTRFGLCRSDGARMECAADDNAALFAATIGGLGLTGLIEWVELQLLRIASPMMIEESQRFGDLDEFFALSRAGEAWPYTVAWIDCLQRGGRIGRGVFFRGRHAPGGMPEHRAPKRRSVPLTPPLSLVNRLSVDAFNRLYLARGGDATRVVNYERYFYPLDAIEHWNRIYGPRGFVQHQSVIPLDRRSALDALLAEVARSGAGSFLSVLKIFGDRPSPGMLSFPRPGVTLAIDFPLHGEPTLALLDRLDRIVVEAGGAIYPAKDAHMSAATFRAGFPRVDEFAAQVDPAFSSGFWRRVMGTR
jgi:FAD/FMN-containing dehydrogenase